MSLAQASLNARFSHTVLPERPGDARETGPHPPEGRMGDSKWGAAPHATDMTGEAWHGCCTTGRRGPTLPKGGWGIASGAQPHMQQT